MAHFAKLDDDNTVIEVNVICEEDVNFLPFPESEPIGLAFLTEWSGGYSNWKQCSYNNNFRGHYPGKGDQYNSGLDIYISSKPDSNPSFVLNYTTGLYEPPTPMPTEGGPWSWDEPSVSWIEFQPPTEDFPS